MPISLNRPYGSNLEIEEINESSAERIGKNIQKIREMNGMSRSELGTLTSLKPARVFQYETGVRRPRIDITKAFAKALGVEIYSLLDPIITDINGVMHTLFQLEELHDLHPEVTDNRYYLMFGDGKKGKLNKFICAWHKQRQNYMHDSDGKSESESKEFLRNYRMWEWAFPRSFHSEDDNTLQLLRIKDEISKHEKIIDELKSQMHELEEKKSH